MLIFSLLKCEIKNIFLIRLNLFFNGYISTFNLVVSGMVTINGSPNLKEHDISGYTFAPLSRSSATEVTTQLLFLVSQYFLCKLVLSFSTFSLNVFFSIIMKLRAFLDSSFAISEDLFSVPIGK